MAKWSSTSVLDGLLDKVATATIMTVCTQQPTTRAEAVTTYALADVALAGGDFSKAAGDISGRKVTIASKNGVTVDANGTGTHIALCDGSNLLYVTTCTSQTLTLGNLVNFPAWDIEVGAPT